MSSTWRSPRTGSASVRWRERTAQSCWAGDAARLIRESSPRLALSGSEKWGSRPVNAWGRSHGAGRGPGWGRGPRCAGRPLPFALGGEIGLDCTTFQTGAYLSEQPTGGGVDSSRSSNKLVLLDNDNVFNGVPKASRCLSSSSGALPTSDVSFPPSSLWYPPTGGAGKPRKPAPCTSGSRSARRRRRRRWRSGLVVSLAVAAPAAAAGNGRRGARFRVRAGRGVPGFSSAPAGGPLRAPHALSEACPAVRGLRCSGPGLTGGGGLLRVLEASRRGRAARLQAGSREARSPPPRPVAPAPCAVALPAPRAEYDPLLTRLHASSSLLSLASPVCRQARVVVGMVSRSLTHVVFIAVSRE